MVISKTRNGISYHNHLFTKPETVLFFEINRPTLFAAHNNRVILITDSWGSTRARRTVEAKVEASTRAIVKGLANTN